MRIRYTTEQVLQWYKEYLDFTVSVQTIANRHKVKNATLINNFKRRGLSLRPAGFRPGNCRGKNGLDCERLRYLHLMKFGYQKRAAFKGLEFTLTEDQFIDLVKGDCFYCGVSSSTEIRRVAKRNINMLTVDRVDSSKGYIMENCVTACMQCNTMKLNYSTEQFLNKIKAVYTKHCKL